MALVIDDSDRAHLADLLGQMAIVVERLEKAPATMPAVPPRQLTLRKDRLVALCGLSPTEFVDVMQCSDEEFAALMKKLHDPSPELPLFSSITPSKAAARTAQFSSLVKELTAAAE